MSTLPPPWVLTTIYWLHMLATVVWIGALSALVILVLPAAGKTLEPGVFAGLLANLQHRLDPLAWACLIVLTGTGMFQMSASPNYQGFLAVENTWAAAILLKHIVFLVITAVSAWSTWSVLPALRRSALLQAKRGSSPDTARVQRQSLVLLRVNLALSVIVLGLTALARIS